MTYFGSRDMNSRRGRSEEAIAITGWGIHLPELNTGQIIEGWSSESSSPLESAHELLGHKGLLYKEPATRLALCAVHRALKLPSRAPRSAANPDPRTAVVGSSNLGNAAT